MTAAELGPLASPASRQRDPQPAQGEMRERLCKAALIYAERFAFAVFPCHWIRFGSCSCGDTHCNSRGKHPLTTHGCKDAATAPDQVCAWWRRWPNANVAIAAGSRSGIVVLDVDPRHAGHRTLADLETRYGSLPKAPTVQTGGGGRHIYLRAPNGVRLSNSAGGLGPGLDVRGEGGYVIAPPSQHASGSFYTWDPSSRVDQVPIADAPAWLVELLISPRQSFTPSLPHQPPSVRTAPLDFIRLAAGIEEGERDNRLFRLACFLRQRGYSRHQAVAVILDAASRCHPPFPPDLAERKVASAWRYR
jgi:hypothetical protein